MIDPQAEFLHPLITHASSPEADPDGHEGKQGCDGRQQVMAEGSGRAKVQG